MFRWLIVKGFDSQLTPGQDFLSTNPALFKHKNTLPSSLASVILIPPAADTPPGLCVQAAPKRVGGGRLGRRLQNGARGIPGPSRAELTHGDAAEGRLVTGRSLVPADPDPKRRGSVLGLPLGPPGAGSQTWGETGGGEQGQREGWSRREGERKMLESLTGGRERRRK